MRAKHDHHRAGRRLLASVIALGCVGFAETATADPNAVKTLVAIAHKQAEDANREAEDAAKRQQKVTGLIKASQAQKTSQAQERVRVQSDVAEQTRRVKLSMTAVKKAADSTVTLCNADNKGIKPLIVDAQKRVELAKRETSQAAEKVRKLIEQKASQQDEAQARELLKQLKQTAIRQTEIATKLRNLSQEVAKLKRCD